jgi:hypothetical protein
MTTALVTLSPIRANEAGTTFTTYTVDRFLVIVPDSALFASRTGVEPAPRNVHVFFSAGAVQGDRGNDVLTHGLRGASAQTEWITIGVHSHDTISDAEIQSCLTSATLNGPVASLRLSGHSRGAFSLLNSVVQKKITTLSILDRVTLMDADENGPGAKSPMLVSAGVPVSTAAGVPVIVAYEVNVRRPHTRGARYISLRSDAMAAIGYVRLIQDAMVTQAGVAGLVSANAAISTQLNSITLPPRGSFTTKGAPGLTSLQKFWADNAKALQVILTNQSNATNGLLAFLNKNDLARFSPFVFDQGISAHHFFAAEVAHELTDSFLPATVGSQTVCGAPSNPCTVAPHP